MLSVSVVIATYNGASYIKEQIDSILAQTHLPDEIIISDDGSSDHTMAIIEEALPQFVIKPRLMTNGVRQGYTRNFIKAADAATGELIVFCDQDDVWRPEKLKILFEHALSSKKRVFYHDFAVIFEDARRPISSYHRHLLAAGYVLDVCMKGCSCAVRRTFLDKWKWPASESNITYDLWIALLASASDDREVIDRVLIEHRIHGKNASGWLLSQETRHPAAEYTVNHAGLGSLIDLCVQRRNIKYWKNFLLSLQGQDANSSLNVDVAMELLVRKEREIMNASEYQRAHA